MRLDVGSSFKLELIGSKEIEEDAICLELSFEHSVESSFLDLNESKEMEEELGVC